MSAPRGRAAYGDQQVDQLLTLLLAQVGQDANDDLVRRLMVAALDMDADEIDRLELKIASQAMVEIHHAWRIFAPYANRAKVTVFGSARTAADAADYRLTQEVTGILADRDWMTISGAGPGIMTAAIEGAGIENSLGVNIVLPFEQEAAPIIEGDPKLATFRYFFTRKLFFMKESDAFLLMPGGFGTLDEAFELLTLVQTGKSYPVPVVLLDHPGSTYWQAFSHFVETALLENGMIGPADTGLFLCTHDATEAADYICHFYSTFHSMRFVGQRLVLRLGHPLSADALATLNREFTDIVEDEIEEIETTNAEQRDDDHPDLARIAFRFNNRSFSRLHAMIRRINDLGHSPRQVMSEPVHDLDPGTEEEWVT